MTKPLDGLRVIDFTHVLAGPACAFYLGLLGAEVIKVERPERGDAMRHRGGTDAGRAAAGMSTAYITQGAGKRSVTIDLETVDGRARMDRFLSDADILVENHRPTTLNRLGLTWDRLHALNPRLIHCALTGYGRDGPLADAPAYDVNIQAASGLMALTGTADTGPLRTGAPVIDYSVALAAGFAICAALVERTRTGQGTFVDVSMLETAFTLMSSTVTDYLLTGNAPQPRGNAANSRSPSAGTFPCKTGLLSLGVNEQAQFVALAHVLQRPEWLTDQRFADRSARDKHGDELATELSDCLMLRDADDWETAMLAAGVPAARVRTLPEALDMPQVSTRAFLLDPDLRVFAVPGLPFRFGGTGPLRAKGGVEPLGGSDDQDGLD